MPVFVFCCIIMLSPLVPLLLFCADTGKSAPTNTAATNRTKRQIILPVMFRFIVVSSSVGISRRASQADGYAFRMTPVRDQSPPRAQL
jgi:hypothetical protein